MSKSRFYPDQDINDMVEDYEIQKGRGPDLKPRKKRGEGSADHGFTENGHQHEKKNVGGQVNHNHYIHQDWNTKKWHLNRRVPKVGSIGTDSHKTEHSSFEEAVAHSKKHS